MGAIAALRAKAMRPPGWENFANRSPVERAVTSSPATDSAITSACAAAVRGYMAP